MKNILFVDDEGKVIKGLQRQLYSMRSEWNMTFVAGGMQALEFMKDAPVDVIVSDMMMPGMDGAELLSKVMEQYPKTIRIVLSGHVGREGALRVVGAAHQFLSKPCEAEELRGAIGRALAMQEIISNDQIKRFATHIKSLPVLPERYAALVKELHKDQPSASALGEIISQDIGMASKVLQLVNSAFFGLPQRLTDAQQAVLYLGTATVSSLVLSQHIFSQFETSHPKGFSMDKLSAHGLQTGAMARRIALLEKAGGEMENQSFLAGLLHDVGKLVLASGMPNVYGAIMINAEEQNRPIEELEFAAFGTTHAEVGGYLLGLWGLPQPIVEAVSHHHQSGRHAKNCFSPLIAVHAANIFAHEMNPGLSHEPARSVDLKLLENLGLAGRVEAWKMECGKLCNS